MNTPKTNADVTENETTKIRILYRAECPKLTPRGKGMLSYEGGVNDATGEIFIRIAANSEGGTCSFEWIELKTIEDLLANRREEETNFSAILFRKAFVSKSANNHGYLAAVLKAENVIAASAEKPTQLNFVSFDSIKVQLNHLKTEDVDLPDLVAAELQEREARKQQRKLAAQSPAETSDNAKKRGRPKKDSTTS